MSGRFPRGVFFAMPALAALTLGEPAHGQQVRLLAPNPGASTGAGDDVAVRLPHENPPFCHWDLREFAQCLVPWQYQSMTAPDLNTNGTADEVADANIAGAIFAAGFQAWQDVQPARLAFTRTGAPGSRTGFALDNFNLLSFAETTSSGDDVQTIAVGNGKPNVVYIIGMLGMLQTIPGGDDQIVPGPGINTGPNGIAESVPIVPDTYIIAILPGRGQPFQACVSRGPNNRLESSAQGDDMIATTLININTGADGICQSLANGIGDLDDATLAITALFYQPPSGIVLETDIVFNTFPSPNALKWVTAQNGAMVPADDIDLLTVATHEIGHSIGLAHPTNNGTNSLAANAVMEPYWRDPAEANHALKNTDQDGCNFIYNPDMGDAPNVDNIFSTTFTSLVRGPANGRSLNGMVLRSRYAGPFHIFDRRERLSARNFTYEWLARTADDMTSECEPNLTDADPMDNGVEYVPDPPRWGEPLTIKLHVKTDSDFHGNPHNYADKPMYANLWVDFDPVDQNWNFTGPEHAINDKPLRAAGVATGSVRLPKTTATIWLRARLTWPEPVSACQPSLSPDLCQHEGATQFGEVEDYPISCKPVYIDLPPFADLFFVWTQDGSNMVVPSYEDYAILNGPALQSTVSGPHQFRLLHPSSSPFAARICELPPRDATDWRLSFLNVSGVSDLAAAHLVLPGPTWQFARLDLLPDIVWRIPCLAPRFGGGTIYAAINLGLYYAGNPLGFAGGAWQPGQSLSDLGISIVNGQAAGMQGILWATSPFVIDPLSAIGFSPSVPGTLLNSASYPFPIDVVQQAKNRFNDNCGCPGDLDMSGTVNAADASGFAAMLLLSEYNPCADLNGDGTDDGGDIPLFVNLALTGGPGSICPSSPTGACCMPDGGCLDGVGAAGCVSAGGTYQGDGSICALVNCPQPVGACCTPFGCVDVLTTDACETSGGIYMGDDSLCIETTCPSFLGACCTPTGCIPDQTAESCELLSGLFQGIDTQCATTNCPGIIGACCMADGSCTDGVTAFHCQVLQGAYQGDNTLCSGGCTIGRDAALSQPRE